MQSLQASINKAHAMRLSNRLLATMLHYGGGAFQSDALDLRTGESSNVPGQMVRFFFLPKTFKNQPKSLIKSALEPLSVDFAGFCCCCCFLVFASGS